MRRSKKRRTERMHPPDDVAREFGVEELETRSDRLLRVVPRPDFLSRLAALALGSPSDEFRIALQQSKVDLAHPLGKQLAASVGGAAVAAPGQFDEPRLRQVGPGPVEPVGEQRLIAAGQPELPFLGGDPEGLADFILQPRNANLVITPPNRLQRRQHELLKTGHAHLFLTLPLTPPKTTCERRRTGSVRLRRSAWPKTPATEPAGFPEASQCRRPRGEPSRNRAIPQTHIWLESGP